MDYAKACRLLISEIGKSLRVPRIEAVLLPIDDPETGKEDEFGFVLLEDGSVGPFYVCLGDTLAQLAWCRTARRTTSLDTLSTALRIGDADLSVSALALGAFNAMSQHVMKRAGFNPATAGHPQNPPAGARVGMVGYFAALAEQLQTAGCQVVVVEQKPERVSAATGIECHTDPGILAGCDSVFCTASTLINNTLDEILAAAGPATAVDLIVPSASGLPDPLFERGVRSAGGILIDQPDELRKALEKGEKWGKCGRKYQLLAKDYPGARMLLGG